jgi:hypothetical protein
MLILKIVLQILEWRMYLLGSWWRIFKQELVDVLERMYLLNDMML